jgi:transcriptional regulator with XRE-family HTH domain
MNHRKLAERIKRERINRNFTQKQLALMIGVDNSVLSRLESAEKEVSLENLAKIAKAFNMSIEYLLYDCLHEDADQLANKILEQIYQLNPQRKDLMLNIIMVLLETSEVWMTSESNEEDDEAVRLSEIGKRIRKERIKQKKTQAALSEAAEVSDGFICALEMGRETASLETLYKISRALNVPVVRLLFNAEGGANMALMNIAEGIKHSGDTHNGILANMITVLMDNTERW